MFKVFSGSWRGIGAGNSPEVLFMQIGFEFRQHLHHFKGAALGVFMCIVLHANQQGESFPSYEQIEAETGSSTDTIGRSLEHLNNLVINGQRVLLRYRIRDGKNRFVGGNRYIVFPTQEQLAQYEIQPTKENGVGESQLNPVTDPESQIQKNPDVENRDVAPKSQTPIFPNVENSERGKSVLKKNHSLKKIKNMGKPARAVAPEPAKPDPETPDTGTLQKRVAAFPLDCQPGAKLLHEIFNLRPLEKPAAGEKGGDFALWVNGLRELAKIAADYDTPLELALRRTWQRWNQSPFNVSHPGALAKTMTSVLAQTSAGQNQASEPAPTALEQALKNFKPRS
jgi:hypothetical protein